MQESAFPWSEVLGTIAFYLIAGASISALDRRLGKKFFSFIERWTGDGKETEERGFIYNRSKGVKWFWAFVFAGLTDAYLVFVSGKSILVESLTILLETPLVYIGFMFGPWMNKLIQHRKTAVEAVENAAESIASGKIKQDVADSVHEVGVDLKNAGSAVATAAKGKAAELKESVAEALPFGKDDEEEDESTEESPEPVAKDAEEPSKEEPVDPYAGKKLSDYLKGH